MERPKLKENPNFSRLVKYVEELLTDEYTKDFEHYLFEEVMETLYGREFWTWYNKNIERFEH